MCTGEHGMVYGLAHVCGCSLAVQRAERGARKISKIESSKNNQAYLHARKGQSIGDGTVHLVWALHEDKFEGNRPSSIDGYRALTSLIDQGHTVRR